MVHFDAREVITFAVKTWNQHSTRFGGPRLAMESPAAAEVLAEDIGDACEVHDVWIEQPTVGDDARFAGVGRSARRAAATEGSKEAPLAALGPRWRVGLCAMRAAPAAAAAAAAVAVVAVVGRRGRETMVGTSRSACRSSGWSERAPRGMTSARRDSERNPVRGNARIVFRPATFVSFRHVIACRETKKRPSGNMRTAVRSRTDR